MPGRDPWLLDTHSCTTSSTSERHDWVDCRVLWTGEPDRIVIVELVSANTTGSFAVPGSGWWRLSYTEASVDHDRLAIRTPAQTNVLPPPPATGAVELAPSPFFFYAGFMDVGTNELGDHEVELSGHVDIELNNLSGGSDSFSAEISVRASGDGDDGGSDEIVGPF